MSEGDIWDCLIEAEDKKEELSVDKEIDIIEHNIASIQSRLDKLEERMDKVVSVLKKFDEESEEDDTQSIPPKRTAKEIREAEKRLEGGEDGYEEDGN